MKKNMMLSVAIVGLTSFAISLPSRAESSHQSQSSQFSSYSQSSGFQVRRRSSVVNEPVQEFREAEPAKNWVIDLSEVEVEIPEMETSEVEIPEVEIPAIALPQITLPRVEVPRITLPPVKISPVRVRRSPRPQIRETNSQSRELPPLPRYRSAIAAPSFSCGPHLVTYRVQALDARPGVGIRCVQFSDGSPGNPLLAWYGEGQWQKSTYRHVGHGFDRGGVLVGSASDLYGNGETTRGNFPGNLNVQILHGGREIRVTGAWNERWIAVNRVAYQPLPSPVTCGQHFAEYRVLDARGDRAGGGVRCMLRVGAENTTWFGNGRWNGKSYSHLGTRSQQGYGASDLCQPGFGTICNHFDYGSLLWQEVVRSRRLQDAQVRGAWQEDWAARW
ncbi:MAG: hypothetical protein VKJ24_15845 [Synechococcales bacterium]|nr:hypothetical protein [Synechococcales bacterium]